MSRYATVSTPVLDIAYLEWNPRGQQVAVHGWCYSLSDGRVRELGMDVAGPDDLQPAYARALAAMPTTGKRDA